MFSQRKEHWICILVILAPYGISGMLMSHVSREIDMNNLKENWERNYPIRHIDGLPDFVEVTAGKGLTRKERDCFEIWVVLGNIRMFYPTCYVYKIIAIDESTANNEPISSNKNSDPSSTKKSKVPPSTTATTTTTTTATTTTTNNTPFDLLTNQNKNDNILIKNLSNQLLISAQRTNCIDTEKKFVEKGDQNIGRSLFVLDRKINVY